MSFCASTANTFHRQLLEHILDEAVDPPAPRPLRPRGPRLGGSRNSISSEIFEGRRLVLETPPNEFFALDVGATVWAAALAADQERVAVGEVPARPLALRWRPSPGRDRCCWTCPARDGPFEMIRLLVFLAEVQASLVPLSDLAGGAVRNRDRNRIRRSSCRRAGCSSGYFQVIAEARSRPGSQEILELSPRQSPALGDEVVRCHPCLRRSPGYQFCTVEYLISAVIERDQFDHRGVKLVLVAHRRPCSLRDSSRNEPLSAMINVALELASGLSR